MGGGRDPGPWGTQGDADIFPSADSMPRSSTNANPMGLDDSSEPLADRFVTQVDCDWVPTPKPDTSPIPVTAANLAELATALSALPESGQGGGKLRADGVPTGTSAAVTVTLHGNLVNRLVQWNGYDQASAAAKAHWDQLLQHLKKHEQRHMDIAVEEGNNLAKLLIGHKIGSTPTITDKVSAANTKMQQRQDDLDSPSESDHGKKVGHAYGDCNIDPSIP
jgi:hypothetical protein